MKTIYEKFKILQTTLFLSKHIALLDRLYRITKLVVLTH